MSRSRSEQMARIRGRDTRPEMRLRKALWTEGLRYRLHLRTAFGIPDVAFPSVRVAVFVDGCFWHGCPLHYSRPRSREEFWADKLASNVLRDRRQTLVLEREGWRVVRFWEHELDEDLAGAVAVVKAAVGGEGATEDGWRVIHVEDLGGEPPVERRHLRRLRGGDDERADEGRRVTAKWVRRGK